MDVTSKIMDNKKLVELVKACPQTWDRNCPLFRDKDTKEKAWQEIAAKMNFPANICKETFKALREKYLREREKFHQPSTFHKPWDLLNDLRFLDPHILPRATMWNKSASEDDLSVTSEPDPTDFDRKLIDLVRKASPIWDRNSNSYPNKTSKGQLWENIGMVLNRDVNSCMLRWKALREKYIRQKAKYMEGDHKWELLDSLVFLDKVIQYRRKQSDFKYTYGDSMPSGSAHYDTPYESAHIRCNFDENSNTDSSNDFLSIVKEENIVQQVADSSFNAKKRPREGSVSNNSESMSEKRSKPEEEGKSEEVSGRSPEQLFGDLVASLLSKKPESQRNLYMIEIMTVLSK